MNYLVNHNLACSKASKSNQFIILLRRQWLAMAGWTRLTMSCSERSDRRHSKHWRHRPITDQWACLYTYRIDLQTGRQHWRQVLAMQTALDQIHSNRELPTVDTTISIDVSKRPTNRQSLIRYIAIENSRRSTRPSPSTSARDLQTTNKHVSSLHMTLSCECSSDGQISNTNLTS